MESLEEQRRAAIHDAKQIEKMLLLCVESGYAYRIDIPQREIRGRDQATIHIWHPARMSAPPLFKLPGPPQEPRFVLDPTL
jgi:hypothetical protein